VSEVAAETAVVEAAESAGSNTLGMCSNTGARVAVVVISETGTVRPYAVLKFERDKDSKVRGFGAGMNRDCSVRSMMEEPTEGMDYMCYSFEHETYNPPAFAERKPAES
jgi:hypothetical protein